MTDAPRSTDDVAAELRQRFAALAAQLGQIEEEIARTFDGLAESYPDRADELTATADEARRTAVRQREIASRFDPGQRGPTAPSRVAGRVS